MNCRFHLPILGLVALTATLTYAQDKKAPANPPAKPAAGAQGQGEMKLPPGMTPEDMAAIAAAGTPGAMHKQLASLVGTWTGQNKCWMAPGTEPMTMPCTATYTSVMDGRFIKCDVSGEMPGMGAFNGFGAYGYDNVGQKFQSTWFDNMGTGMMVGTGELSPDGKTMTWTYNYNCPIAKKQVTMREVDKVTGEGTRVMEMYGPDKTGKEFKTMEITFTRKGGAPVPASSGK